MLRPLQMRRSPGYAACQPRTRRTPCGQLAAGSAQMRNQRMRPLRAKLPLRACDAFLQRTPCTPPSPLRPKNVYCLLLIIAVEIRKIANWSELSLSRVVTSSQSSQSRIESQLEHWQPPPEAAFSKQCLPYEPAGAAGGKLSTCYM